MPCRTFTLIADIWREITSPRACLMLPLMPPPLLSFAADNVDFHAAVFSLLLIRLFHAYAFASQQMP